ncbi:uncharacterized protein LOC110176494 [Drosophila serrata]|uniref:uncharacterized protein LOC110176494 n=1 Tax=Drosophila serrata TaxID=7274 RepID=UPI000A1D1AD4|nr:uncharacterized protein LOC110176494 [Drosophila serrata]
MATRSIISREMVHILPCERDDRITMPDVIDDSLPFHVNTESETGGGDEATQESKCEPETVVEEPDSEDSVKGDKKYAWNAPCIMIIFKESDLNSALHYLIESLQDPFALDAVSVLLVQESLVDELIGRVVSLMKPLDSRVANHPCYKHTLQKLVELKAEVVVGPAEKVLPDATPMLVRDLPHRYLGQGPTGIITMHVFRTPYDATRVYRKEYPMPFASASIWSERISGLYEVMGLMDIVTFQINCFNVSMEPIKKAFEYQRNHVTMHKGYHYETLMVNYSRKIVVYPVGTIFGN